MSRQPPPVINDVNLLRMKELLQLEQIKMHLLDCRFPSGAFAAEYIPLLLTQVDDASEALRKGYLTEFVVHKTAVDEGVNIFVNEMKALFAAYSSLR